MRRALAQFLPSYLAGKRLQYPEISVFLSPEPHLATPLFVLDAWLPTRYSLSVFCIVAEKQSERLPESPAFCADR
jgi:hypothetical protein